MHISWGYKCESKRWLTGKEENRSEERWILEEDTERELEWKGIRNERQTGLEGLKGNKVVGSLGTKISNNNKANGWELLGFRWTFSRNMWEKNTGIVITKLVKVMYKTGKLQTRWKCKITAFNVHETDTGKVLKTCVTLYYRCWNILTEKEGNVSHLQTPLNDLMYLGTIPNKIKIGRKEKQGVLKGMIQFHLTDKCRTDTIITFY